MRLLPHDAMYTFELTANEAQELRDLLQMQISMCLNELAHTDARDYRKEVRARCVVLEDLYARLTRLVAADPASHPAQHP